MQNTLKLIALRAGGYRASKLCTVMGMAFVLSSCSLLPAEDLKPPAPLVAPTGSNDGQVSGQLAVEKDAQIESKKPKFTRGPGVQGRSAAVTERAYESPFAGSEGDEKVFLNLNNLPLPAFINEVFGNVLGMDFQIAPEVAEKKDLVSVRVSDDRSKEYVYNIARDVLESYGVALVRHDDYMRFVLGRTAASNEAPILLTGAALPSVPESHRPVIYIRSLKVITPADAYNMIRSIFNDQSELIVERDNARNALRIQGASELVQNAAQVLDMLDQPLLRGHNVLRVSPEYTTPKELAERLTKTLSAQGYEVGEKGTNTVFVPVDNLGALFVFTPTKEMQVLVRRWVAELDQVPPASASGEAGLFWYAVKNTPAADLAMTLNAMLGDSGASSATFDESGDDRRLQGREPVGSNSKDRASTAATSVQGSFVVNEARNMLLFRGEGERWQQLLPIIKELDVAPDQVLVEVVVAEVTLTDQFRFGIEWALNELSAAGAMGNLSSSFGETGVGSGLGAGGLLWTSISGSGNTRIALNAFASSNKVTILQTPKILVRSGEQASVRVGTEVPIITRQATGEETIEGTSAIIQDVQFRKTGVQLTVLPRVFSDGRIDLEISQEVSEAQPNQTSTINSPTILTRNVETRLSLQDGSSVLLGGLISSSEAKGDSRVPFLGDIPWLGQLFRTDSTSADRTELMVLVVPYRVRTPQQAQAISEAFRQQLRLINTDNTDYYPMYKGGQL